MDFNEVINSRRAVNFFDPDKEVADSMLKKIVAMASLSPSGFNLQPWSLIVLRDLNDKTRLKKLAWNQEKVTEAPVVLIILADTEGWKPGNPFAEKNFQEMVKGHIMQDGHRKKYEEMCNSLYGLSQERKVAFACKNAAFFGMSLMLAAKSMGLDTHPMDGFDLDGVKNEFKIPDNYWIPLLLAVGYFRSDKKLLPPKWRKTYDEIVVRFDK